MTEKPEQFVVYWYDWKLGRRLAKERGVSEEDVDPAAIEQTRNFSTLEAARTFCATVEREGGYIEERVGFVERSDGPLHWWDWEQERID